jgi:uncharacterized protein (TIGR02145 family)
MKKTILILFLAFLAVCTTCAQEMIRYIQAGEWEKILDKDIIYTIEPNGNTILIKEEDTTLHILELPESILFSSIDSAAIFDDGVIINGIKWATRNLAAHGRFVENTKNYGALFQWGRKGDGHQQRASSTLLGPVSGSQNFDENGQIVKAHEAYGKFIKLNDVPYDWRTPQMKTLWNSGSESFPTKTANDPCPDGWRLPTHTEFITLGNGVWTTIPTEGRRFGNGDNTLFLPAAGSRNSNGMLLDVGIVGIYWSSSINNTSACYFAFHSNEVFPNISTNRGAGMSVRCVSEF